MSESRLAAACMPICHCKDCGSRPKNVRTFGCVRQEEYEAIIDKQAKQIKADDEEIKALICANPHNEVNIRELEKQLKAKENEISRLHRIIELDEQIEQALKAEEKSCQKNETTELVGLLQQTVWIAEKAERDDCEDTTLELARQAIERSKHG